MTVVGFTLVTSESSKDVAVWRTASDVKTWTRIHTAPTFERRRLMLAGSGSGMGSEVCIAPEEKWEFCYLSNPDRFPDSNFRNFGYLVA